MVSMVWEEDAIEYAKRAGAVIANAGEPIPRTTIKNEFGVTIAVFGVTPAGEDGGADPAFYREAGNNRMPFPYLHGQRRLDTQSSFSVLWTYASGTTNLAALPVGDSQRVLFGTNWTVSLQQAIISIGKITHADSGSARGFRYGIMDINSLHSSLIFRSDRYGQFRDMLEQRSEAKYFTNKEIQESPVTIRFVKPGTSTPESAINTTSQNLSQEFTSSLPYFDGVAVDRPDDPLAKAAASIPLGL